MPQSQHASSERTVFLSTLPASVRERQVAAVVALVFLVLAAAAAPFARVKLAEVWAFIPSYQSSLLVNDPITAILLFAQFPILGSHPLVILAAGYLFTALVTVPHALSFPRLFVPDGLIGAGPQTTAWLYMVWHSGLPLAVIAFALYPEQQRVRRTWTAIVTVCFVVVAAVAAATALTTVGHDLLPVIMRRDGYTPLLPVVTTILWSLSLMALLALWRRPAKSVLDVWLMVVMSAWLFDVGLSAVLNAGRFDLGFYAGRVVRPHRRDAGAAGPADRDGSGLFAHGTPLRGRAHAPRSAIA